MWKNIKERHEGTKTRQRRISCHAAVSFFFERIKKNLSVGRVYRNSQGYSIWTRNDWKSDEIVKWWCVSQLKLRSAVRLMPCGELLYLALTLCIAYWRSWIETGWVGLLYLRSKCNGRVEKRKKKKTKQNRLHRRRPVFSVLNISNARSYQFHQSPFCERFDFFFLFDFLLIYLLSALLLLWIQIYFYLWILKK